MEDMTASEFISKALNDKAFLLEMCKHIPDELLNEKNEQPEGTELAAAMDQFYFEASKAMGYEFDEDEFNTEFARQVNALSKFGKVKFIGRLIRTLSKAGKGKKKK